MEGLFVLVGGLFALAYPVVVILVFVLLRRVHRLRERVDVLDVRVEILSEASPRTQEAVPRPAESDAPTPAAEPVPGEPAAEAVPGEPAPVVPAAEPAPEPAPVVAAASLAIPTAPTPALVAASGAFEVSKLEQLIGGIWLQNTGSVLLLLGSFFLILWGYTQGKLGPEVLVAASVTLGVVLAWRGDRLSRTLRPLGSALLGVGLGIVYISLYLGHFRMNVLSEAVAFLLLSLTSLATVDIGLRRSQPVIAAFGVLGAFLPLTIPVGAGFAFTLPLHSKLAYLAAANAVVFTLTAIRGWSILVLFSLLMTSVAWTTNQTPGGWSLSVQIGLSLLFTALGVAPVIRLARTPDPIRPVDLGVVVLAPILLFVVSLPFFREASAGVSGSIFAALGALNLAAAVWVDARRTERDLWRPLTAIGTLFVTAALERFLAKENLALAWAVEGAVLIWLGLAPRGGWLRGLGYGISILAAARLLFFAGSYEPSLGGGIGILNGFAVRDLLCIVTFIVISDRLARRRDACGDVEARAAHVWLVGVNLLLMQWIVREAPHYTRLLLGPQATASITAPTPAEGVEWVVHRTVLGAALGWTVQFATLCILGFRNRSRIQRMVGYGVGVAGFLAFALATSSEPSPQATPTWIFHPAGGILAFCVAVFLVTARCIERRRKDLEGGESLAPALATFGAHGSLLIWTGLESVRIARVLAADAPPAQAFWTAACLVQTMILLILSQRWKSGIQRHVAYFVGVIGFLSIVSAMVEELDQRASADPFTDPAGLVLLVSILLLYGAARFLDKNRAELGEWERKAPEHATIAANAALMLWLAMEAGRLATALPHGSSLSPGTYDARAMLAAVLLSACWILQAAGLLILGWIRRSPFLRWIGLTIVGVTIVKFVVADLQRVDIFWRFVIALGVGVVLLVVSFVYQRLSRQRPAS